MYAVVVQNHIDFYELFESDSMVACVLWAIAALSGPCRSGGAEFYERSILYEEVTNG